MEAERNSVLFSQHTAQGDWPGTGDLFQFPLKQHWRMVLEMEFLSEGAGISGRIGGPMFPLRRHQQVIKGKEYSEKSYVIHTHKQKETWGITEPNSVTTLSVALCTLLHQHWLKMPGSTALPTGIPAVKQDSTHKESWNQVSVMDNKPVPQFFWKAFVTYIHGNAQKSWS